MSGVPGATRIRSLRFLLMAGATIAVLLSASCASSVDTEVSTKALTQRDDDWSKAAATKNADSVAAFYAADAIAYPTNEPVAIGQAAAKKVWASYFADSTFSISWKTEHAGVAKSGDLGFTAGTYADSFRGPDGTLVTEKGKYVCTWAKQPDGTWKAIHDIWNTDSK
jgi:ketosteroid isomerase-like protein